MKRLFGGGNTLIAASWNKLQEENNELSTRAPFIGIKDGYLRRLEKIGR